MNENAPEKRSTSEKGHAKFLESFDRLIAVDATLDAVKLDAPLDLSSAKLAAMRETAGGLLDGISAAKANWRTVALERQTEADALDSTAAQAVALLEGRGADAATVEDARSIVRKLRGDRQTARIADDPLTVGVDESAQNISNSQQSNAARLASFRELVDYLAAQPIYGTVKKEDFKIADLQSFAEDLETKHNASIVAATALDTQRGDRNEFYYTGETSILNIAKRYKKLVFGTYGGDSDEYRMVNEIPFEKP